MAHSPDPAVERYPWGYLLIALLPLELLAVNLLAWCLGNQKALALGMMLAMLAPVAGALATLIGVIRLRRGDGQRYPALKRLVWLAALLAVTSFVAL